MTLSVGESEQRGQRCARLKIDLFCSTLRTSESYFLLHLSVVIRLAFIMTLNSLCTEANEVIFSHTQQAHASSESHLQVQVSVWKSNLTEAYPASESYQKEERFPHKSNLQRDSCNCHIEFDCVDNLQIGSWGLWRLQGLWRNSSFWRFPANASIGMMHVVRVTSNCEVNLTTCRVKFYSGAPCIQNRE